MVDVKQIQRLLVRHFVIVGSHSIDPHSGVVDVYGNAKLHEPVKVTQLPVRFGNVQGNFWCYGNNLKTLQGAPTSVDGYFICSDNKLESLQGAPKSVGKNFDCSHNSLESLHGAPESLVGNFLCNHNRLESLQGAPKSVGKIFDCSNNSLESLEGAHMSVGVEFTITYNPQLPLLRLLAYDLMEIYNAPDAVKEIMKRYQGQGRNGSLACGAELAREGFKENARW